MDSEEYFERVVRFFETKGWNTSTTQVNDAVYIVTGTRQSDTYYDRMMAMVGLGPETRFGDKHVRYLVDAATDHDVDQLLATTRGGFENGTQSLLSEYGIEIVDPETIDDAFIDGFEVEPEEGLFDGASEGLSIGTNPLQRTLGLLVTVYLAVAVVVGVSLSMLGALLGATGTLSSVLAVALVLFGPVIALSATTVLVTSGFPSPPSPVGLFAGVVLGSVLFTILVGGSGGAVGLTAATGLFASTAALFVVLGLSLLDGLLAVGVAYAYATFGGREGQS